MKKTFISLFLGAFVLSSHAQTSCNIKKAYAFYTVSVPGAQMADENGNPINPIPDIRKFIYIEWRGNTTPKIESVLYNNKALAATITAVKTRSVIPGGNIGNNNDFKITAAKNNSLWQIKLQPGADNAIPDRDCKNIIIKTKETGKRCTFKLTKETELTTMPRY